MRVMVLVKATAHSEAGFADTPDDRAMMAEMGRFNDALEAAGIIVMAAGLMPTSAGRRIAFDGDARNVMDGPFLPADAQVAGFWIWEVADMDEAVAWAARCPNPMPGGGVLELRPFYNL